MPAPEVSVCTPPYDGARYLEQAIEGVPAQDFANWEPITCGDGSTDEAAEVVARIATRASNTGGNPSVRADPGRSIAVWKKAAGNGEQERQILRSMGRASFRSLALLADPILAVKPTWWALSVGSLGPRSWYRGYQDLRRLVRRDAS